MRWKSACSSRLTRLVLLVGLLALIAGVQVSGLAELFSADGLDELLLRCRNCPPIVYIAAFGIASVLLLPASPFVILAGLLYGPFWGLVYALIGATTGASLAFAVARYMTGDFIRRRLKGPRWSRLQENVEKHGWKMVAFTRLIPLFPFTLVNYAFGMTRIKFSHYATVTAICMVPACFAFVLFSSSVPDLINGHVSGNFAIGLGLITAIGAVPVAYTYLFKGGKL